MLGMDFMLQELLKTETEKRHQLFFLPTSPLSLSQMFPPKIPAFLGGMRPTVRVCDTWHILCSDLGDKRRNQVSNVVWAESWLQPHLPVQRKARFLSGPLHRVMASGRMETRQNVCFFDWIACLQTLMAGFHSLIQNDFWTILVFKPKYPLISWHMEIGRVR